MKKFLFALMCLAALTIVPACDPNPPIVDPENPENPEKPDKPDNPDNPNNPDDDKDLTPWQKCLKHVKPGIYKGVSDEEAGLGMNMGYDQNILAITEDGYSFVVDLDGGSVVAPFTIYDGDLTFIKVTASEPKTGVYEHDKEITTYAKEQLQSLSFKMCDIEKQVQFWAIEFGFSNYQTGTMIDNYFRKIDDAPDFQTTYQKIFNLAKKKGEYVAYDDLFTTVHTVYGDGWHNEFYPDDMNSKRWVVPYDGDGTIERFAVYRQRGWSEVGNRYVFYAPCNWENVTYVECDVICEEADAISWFDKITAMTDRYNAVDQNSTGIIYQFNDPSKVSSVGYHYYSNDEDNSVPDGYKGYVHPEYNMQWMAPYGTFITPMSIKFGVSYVTYV